MKGEVFIRALSPFDALLTQAYLVMVTHWDVGAVGVRTGRQLGLLSHRNYVSPKQIALMQL